MLSKPFALSCLLLIAGACVLSPGCAGRQTTTTTRKAISEAPPPPPESNPIPDLAAASSAPALPQPKPSEVSAVVERVFKGAATVVTDREPFFVVGYFNDDTSQDIAVAVKTSPDRLSEMNDELAGWIVVAPVRPATTAPNDLPYSEVHAAAAVRRRRVVVDEGEVLLAVIHGFGSDGWRDPQATQTYVLKNAAGGKMKTREFKQVLTADTEEKLPRLRGDVIAQTIGGQTGFLYYDGAKYSWYDPRNYRPSPPPRIVHGGPAVAAQK